MGKLWVIVGKLVIVDLFGYIPVIMSKLKNSRHETFVRNYVSNGGNASKAARAAGCTTVNAGTQGNKWMKNAAIQQRIFELLKADELLYEMSREETISEINKLAAFNMADYYDDDGVLIPIHELDSALAVGISEFEVDHDRAGLPYISKMKAGKDKRAALDMQMRHHNLYEKHQAAGGGVININLDEKDMKA
jgi:hypothetical protein